MRDCRGREEKRREEENRYDEGWWDNRYEEMTSVESQEDKRKVEKKTGIFDQISERKL